MSKKKKSVQRSDRTKGYQFSVRIPEAMRNSVEKRIVDLNFNTLAEYVRHLMVNDMHGEGAEDL